MSPNSWQDAGGSPQPSQPPAFDDRQMIRHLASRYTPAELARLFQEEGKGSRPPPADDQASIVSYASSTISEEPPSVFDSASIRSFSDTSSITGSIFSNVSAKFLGRKSQSSSAQAAAVAQAQVQAAQAEEAASWPDQEMAASEPATATSAETPASASALINTATKQKGAFMCGFCTEEDILKTCTRKNDLKRHIEDFHNVNAQWFCKHRGCQMVFDWQTAYKTHLKQAHGGSRMSLDEAKVNLCPQVVYACGFDGCRYVFEASGDNDTMSTFKEYVGHVVKHFDEGAQSGEWTYTTRIRNLMRQSQVAGSWADCGWSESDKSRLQWYPQTSGILRKRLECRHITDVKILIQYALQLGSDSARIQKFRDDFVTPILDTCTQSGPGHNARKQSLPQEPADPFQFRISRNPNPNLAAYLASQRRVYVPSARQPHRSSSRAQPSPRSSMGTPTSNPMTPHLNGHGHGHYFPALPNSATSSPLYDSNPPAFSQPQGNMLHQGGGIIADDLRSLRSMATSSPEPSDIDMGDAAMMTTDFAANYATGIQSPSLASPVAMEHALYIDHSHQHSMPHAF